MDPMLQVVGYGGLVPAAVAIGIAWLMSRALPIAVAQRFALAAGLAAGFLAGYALLPDWAPLVPQRHWQWLPWLGLLAAVVGPLQAADGILATQRWMHLVWLSLIAAWLLVPAWDDLWPPRPFSVALLTAYLTLVAALPGMLPERLLGPLLCGVLTLSAATVAGLVAAGVSAKLGQVALIAAAALAGCWVFAAIGRRSSTSIQGLIPVYAILAGGAAYAGCVEPDPPLPALLIAPAAPLVLWAFAAGPLAALRRWASAAAQVAAVLAVLIAAAAWAMLATA